MRIMNTNLKIKKVETIEECLACNKLLEGLIFYESKLDNEIVPNSQIKDFYERTLNKSDCVIYVALVNDKIIGYVMAYIQNENKKLKNRVVSIMNIFIEEEFRNQNIGKKLIQQVEMWAKTILEKFVIELDCISNNLNALEFYKNLGFNPVRIKMRKS